MLMQLPPLARNLAIAAISAEDLALLFEPAPLVQMHRAEAVPWLAA